MVWVSLGLLALVALLVHLNTRFDRWNLAEWRFVFRPAETLRAPLPGSIRVPPEPPRLRMIEYLDVAELLGRLPAGPGIDAGPVAFGGALRASMYQGASMRLFAGSIIVGMLGSFLMPLWTLTFAGESLGRARENRTLTWLLLRPLPRPTLYLASYLAALPWCLALNLGGYYLYCLLGGEPGARTLPLLGLPVLLGTLTFAALFQLLSVTFRRAGILGLLYVFFFETIAGNLPGQQKRLSISYYVRCLMIDRVRAAGVTLDLPGTRPAVEGPTAILVLTGVTLALVLIGMWIFARKEYAEPAAN